MPHKLKLQIDALSWCVRFKAGEGRYLDPADAKVSNFGATTDIKQNVLRLEVPVHHAGMQVCQPLCHVVRDLHATACLYPDDLRMICAANASEGWHPCVIQLHPRTGAAEKHRMATDEGREELT